MTTIAVLGTGIMGEPIARNLARAEGIDVRVWNRTRAKAQPLDRDGATVCDTAAEAATGADLVVTTLIDAGAVADTMAGPDGALDAMTGEAVWVQVSTVGPAGTTRLAAMAQAAGVAFVDAPVLGTRAPAEQGQLVVLASGSAALRERVQPMFDVIGSRTIWVGEDAGPASQLKLVCNSWVLAVTTAVAEAMALSAAFGLDGQLFLDAIAGGALDLPYAQLKGKSILAETFPASFPVSGAAKDAGLITTAGADAGVTLLLADAVRRQLESARDSGHADEDMAAVYYAARNSG